MSTPAPTAILGRSIVAGRTFPETGGSVFHGIDPTDGTALDPPIQAAGPGAVEAAAVAAAEAFAGGGLSDPAVRAAGLRLAAQRILDLGTVLTGQMGRETGLPAARCAGERDRTVAQLRMFADLVTEGSWVEAVIDHGDPARTPMPKPDVRRMLRPLGPVAVFGAGNFPLAFGAAGGDTASALAAGCPVVVKGHPGHPGTGELVARAVADALLEAGLPPGTFSFLHSGGDREVGPGQELVRHPAIRAVGFTGSQAGGRALGWLAAGRTDPIPVFAEMGSLNPTFILEDALLNDGPGIAAKLAGAILGSSGQLCTKPGIIVLVQSNAAEDGLARIRRVIGESGPVMMLGDRIRRSFEQRAELLRDLSTTVGEQGTQSPKQGAWCIPVLWEVHAAAFLTHCTTTVPECPICAADYPHELGEECFGPAVVVVRCESDSELLAVASNLPGSLAASVFAGPLDEYLLSGLTDLLAARAGRIVFNGVTTGVEVCAAMHHGGPFPATNRPDATSVGTASIRRWCRPVAWQNAPDSLLPPELQEANPRHLFRIVDGRRCEPKAEQR